MPGASRRRIASARLTAAARRLHARPARLWQLALAALAGNLCLHQLPVLPAPGLTFGLAIAALALLAVGRFGVTSLPAFALLAFCGTAEAARDRLASRWPAAADGRDLALSGWIDELPRREAGRWVFSFRVAAAGAAGGTAVSSGAAPRRVRLSWYDPAPPLVAGQALQLVARLRSPRGLVNRGTFDYERWLYLEAYDASGYVRSGEGLDDRRFGLAQSWLEIRAALFARLGAQIDDPDARALIQALALGERAGFEDRHWNALTRTGTSHLVAVSGLHIGIIAGMAWWIALRLGLWLPYRFARHAPVLAACLCLVPATAYAALAGFALPTQRALVMLVAAQLSLVGRRRWHPVNGLGLALLGVLALDPQASLSASLWLSFGAVALLLVAVDRYRSDAGSGGLRLSAVRYLSELTRLQWTLTLGLLPLGLWFFAQLSLASFGVNLLAIPLFSLLVVPLSLLVAVAAAVGFEAGWLFEPAAMLCGLAWRGIDLVAALPFAALGLARPSLAEFLLALAALALALPWHPLPGRRLAWLGLLPMLLPDPSRLAPGEARISVLDVGQGLAVAIETAGHRALYDAGPVYQSGFDAGAEIVAPALAALGARRLDLLILSHGDSDHAGGAAAILARYPEAELLAGPDVEHPAARPCREGQQWTWDGVEFEVLHPPAGFSPQGNDSSCVVRIATIAGSVLLTGDIEARGEARIARQQRASDIVVVPHHGSLTSSSRALVSSLQAQLAIVSAGHNNRWGFPRPEVRQRWTTAGAALLMTGDDGAIELLLTARGIEVHAARDRRQRYWQAVRDGVSGAINGLAL